MNDLVRVGRQYLTGPENDYGEHNYFVFIDPATGALTERWEMFWYSTGYAKRSDGKVVFSTTAPGNPNENTLRLLNTPTGAQSVIGIAGAISSASINGLASDPDSGAMFASTAANDLWAIDPFTAGASFLGKLPDGTQDIAFVPTPNATVLFGFVGLGSLRGRARTSSVGHSGARFSGLACS